MDTIKINVKRSEEWVLAQRLARGTNVAESVTVDVNPAELSEAARAVILAQEGGAYRDLHWISHNCQYEITMNSSYGREYLVVDADSPTVAQIDAAILAAAQRIDAKREEAKLRAEENARANAKREEEKAARKAKLAEARQLLADELKSGETALARLKTLAEFLAAVPPDAKRGALRKLAANATEEAIAALRTEIENAAPCWVLQDIDDECADEEDN